MDCECHGEAAYWQKDSRAKAGGWWECRVKRREHNRTRTTDPDRREKVNAQRRDYMRGPGYIVDRRRVLSGQRQRILEQLDQLAQEASNVES